MRADAALEDGVAVVQQVMRGDGGGQVGAGVLHVLRRFLGRDVLEHDLELGEVAAQRAQDAVDEDGLAVEQVDLGVGHLAVHQQQQARALHGLQRPVGLAHVGHAGIAVGGGTGRVELERDHAGVPGTRDFIGRRVVGEVQRHQGLEGHAGRHRRLDARLVGQRLRGRGHGRAQVGHDDGARELRRRVRHHGGQRGAVAHVQVPVVGAGEGEGLRGGHGAILAPGLMLPLTPDIYAKIACSPCK